MIFDKKVKIKFSFIPDKKIGGIYKEFIKEVVIPIDVLQLPVDQGIKPMVREYWNSLSEKEKWRLTGREVPMRGELKIKEIFE